MERPSEFQDAPLHLVLRPVIPSKRAGAIFVGRFSDASLAPCQVVPNSREEGRRGAGRDGTLRFSVLISAPKTRSERWARAHGQHSVVVVNKQKKICRRILAIDIKDEGMPALLQIRPDPSSRLEQIGSALPGPGSQTRELF